MFGPSALAGGAEAPRAAPAAPLLVGGDRSADTEVVLEGKA